MGYKQKHKEHYYQNFIDSLNRSEQTKLKYIIEFNNFLKYLKVQDPDTLITERLLDSPQEIRQVENQIRDYIKYLNKVKGWGNKAISVARSSILKFYEVNRVNLNRRFFNQFMPAQKKLRKDLAYSHKQIEKLLNCTKDLRDKAMILLLASTGMRIGALPYLSLGNLSRVHAEGYHQDSYIYKIVVYEKEPEEHYTFCTFECTKAINDYLEYRETFEEVLKPESPLLREKFNSNIAGGAALEKPQFIKVKSFQATMSRLLVQAGLRKKTAKEDRHLHENMESHGFRKFANTQMIKAGVDYNTKEHLLGHRKNLGLDSSYDRTPEGDRLREYSKAIDLLTISNENRLRKQVAEQDYTIKVQLEQQRKQNEEQEKQIERLQKDMRIVLHANMRKSKALQDIELGERLNTARKKLVR